SGMMPACGSANIPDCLFSALRYALARLSHRCSSAGATMSQQSSLTQSAHSVRQVLTAYTVGWARAPTTAALSLTTASLGVPLGGSPASSTVGICGAEAKRVLAVTA